MLFKCSSGFGYLFISRIIIELHTEYIEKKQGRVRTVNSMSWQPRTLDLDILLFGKRIVHTDTLTIPHYDMFNREFVIYPLIELDNYLVFPNGQSMQDVVRTVSKNGFKFLEKWRF